MLHLIDASDPNAPFPDPALAERDPDGLLALGGDLAPARLLNAYRQGIFPWYSEHDPILWWSPDPRMVLFPEELEVSRSLRKSLRRGHFSVSMDQAFDNTIQNCSGPRKDDAGTWLQPEMIQAYQELHRQGHAHSVETWLDGELVGGLYGIALGGVFFGESMFSRTSDASKTALVFLVETLLAHGFSLIDCQVYSAHLESLGACEIPRQDFQRRLGHEVDKNIPVEWNLEPRNSRELAAVR